LIFRDVTGAIDILRYDGSVWHSIRPFSFESGVAGDGGGFKHKRLTTGSINATTDVDVTVTWGTTFADANYTVTASVVDATAANASLKIVHITSVSAANCVIRVRNDSAGALTGTLHVHAIHD
jgi:hypothetical protein